MDTDKALDIFITRQLELMDALVAQSEAKFKLEESKTVLIIQGVEGKNQSERDARLRDSLDTEYLTEHKASIQVIKAKGCMAIATHQIEMAKIEAHIRPA